MGNHRSLEKICAGTNLTNSTNWYWRREHRGQMALKLVIFTLLALAITCSAWDCFQATPGYRKNFIKTLLCPPGSQCMGWRYDNAKKGGARCASKHHIDELCGKKVVSARGTGRDYHVCCCNGDRCNHKRMVLACTNTEILNIP